MLLLPVVPLSFSSDKSLTMYSTILSYKSNRHMHAAKLDLYYHNISWSPKPCKKKDVFSLRYYMTLAESWLKLAQKHYSGWIVVREKHCSGWKNKPNKLNIGQAKRGHNKLECHCLSPCMFWLWHLRYMRRTSRLGSGERSSIWWWSTLDFVRFYYIYLEIGKLFGS